MFQKVLLSLTELIFSVSKGFVVVDVNIVSKGFVVVELIFSVSKGFVVVD